MEHIAQIESAEAQLHAIDQMLTDKTELLLHLPVLEGATCAVQPLQTSHPWPLHCTLFLTAPPKPWGFEGGAVFMDALL